MLLRSSGRRTWVACSTPHSAVTWTSGNTVPTPGMGVMPELENEPPAFGRVLDDPRTAFVVLSPSPSARHHAFPQRFLEMLSRTSARLARPFPASRGRSPRCRRQFVTVPPDPRDLSPASSIPETTHPAKSRVRFLTHNRSRAPALSLGKVGELQNRLRRCVLGRRSSDYSCRVVCQTLPNLLEHFVRCRGRK